MDHLTPEHSSSILLFIPRNRIKRTPCHVTLTSAMPSNVAKVT